MKVFKAIILTIFIMMCGSVVSAADLSVNGENLPVYTLQKAGNDNENFVILILGDGYTASEQEEFVEDASSRSAELLATEPFRTYSDKINIYAVGAVSADTNVSTDGYERDTYFSLYNSGNYIMFQNGGDQKAYAIRNAMEKDYLDSGTTVGTIHFLLKSQESFGMSSSRLFSFSSTSSGIGAFIHEISHSIGRLKDEYGALKNGVNSSASENVDELPWSKLFGFREIGYTHNENGSAGYIPSLSCIMLSVDNCSEFCEVCKLELAKWLNSYLYMQSSERYYVANPDITLEHPINMVRGEYKKKYQIINGNLLKAQNKSLEFRTVVQNLVNEEQHLKLLLQIIDEYGNVKISKEEEFFVPPLPVYSMAENDYEPAKQSLSLKIDRVSGLTFRDKILGQVIDCKTNKVVATDKTASLARRKVNIHHKLKNADGTVTDMPNVSVSTVYVAEGDDYSPKPPKRLGGYTYLGNSLGADKITAADADIDVDYYYGTVGLAAEISADGKTVTVTPSNVAAGNKVVLAMYDGEAVCEIKSFVCDGAVVVYSPQEKYTSVKAFVWDEQMLPLCSAAEASK